MLDPALTVERSLYLGGLAESSDMNEVIDEAGTYTGDRLTEYNFGGVKTTTNNVR